MADVVLIRWPEDKVEATRLVHAGVPLLYLVEQEGDPPIPTSCLEDWIRSPSDDRDLRARVVALELRASAHHASPFVDDDGRLHFRGNVVPLPPTEARLAAALVTRFNEVVSDIDLVAGLAEDDVDSPMPLRGLIARLRSRLRHVDLVIHRARGLGYTLGVR